MPHDFTFLFKKTAGRQRTVPCLPFRETNVWGKCFEEEIEGVAEPAARQISGKIGPDGDPAV